VDRTIRELNRRSDEDAETAQTASESDAADMMLAIGIRSGVVAKLRDALRGKEEA
jgi:hypothetical protein